MLIGMTVGVFDCFHQGHANLLRQLRMKTDRVLVIIHDDQSTFQNKNRFTVQPLEQRLINLWRSGFVDEVYPLFAADPTGLIEKCVIAHHSDSFIYMRGDDWGDFPGRTWLERHEIPIILLPYTEGVSTTAIRQEIRGPGVSRQ